MVIDEELRTRDVGEAEEQIARVYRRAQFQDSAAPFEFRQHVVGDDRAHVARFAISSRAELAVEMDGVFGVGQHAGGSYRAASNRDDVDVTGPFLLRPGLAQSWSKDLDLVMVNLNLAELSSFAGVETRTDRLTFDACAPISPAAGRQWANATAHAVEVFSAPELLHNDLLRRATVDVLFASVLTSFPIAVHHSGSDPSTVSLPSAMQRAVRFIEDNADRPVGVQEIADAARMSVRGLQFAFRRTFGSTPMGYLRTVRLAAAHQELLAADATVETVGRIANRWGFTNRGRFAAEHQATFNETPRHTLQR